MQYGAEIWGLNKSAMYIENIHLFALKRFLGVHVKTPNELVYGETGRYPIYINSSVQCVRYWLKMLRMDNDRLPFKAYKMLLGLESRGKKSWVSCIRDFLFQNGFGFVWINQGVENVNVFLKELRQRLVDNRWQGWDENIQSSCRYSFYRTFKTNYDCEAYLYLDLDRHVTFFMTRFRLGISNITVHRYRYANIRERDMLCPLCKKANEDEVHFLFSCPVYLDLRHEHIPRKFSENPCSFRAALLMANQNKAVMKNVCLYLYKAFKRRGTMLS
eukprot:TRINITY_DN6881_c0_g1_i1.p1 TRINITY_DN6881_c0_g1~~TRINITY_DN6881_c0_g1_i1.p1  ORF type:complete len:302 (+),score=4.84 TRINITY_DN6881_c0_g1_i1:89-907(+)